MTPRPRSSGSPDARRRPAARRDAQRRTLAQELHSSAIRLLRRVRAADVAMGVSPARASVLSILVFSGPKTLGELARLEQVRPPTMTRMVQGLERAGHVRTTRDREDARVVLVAATAAGTRLLHEGRDRRVDMVEEMLAPLDPTELATLADAAQLLARVTAPPTAASGRPVGGSAARRVRARAG